MSTKIVIKTTDRVVPMIYAYTTPEIARHNGWTKIGYTEQDVDKRLSQQTHTADVEYKEEWRGNATFEDGSGDTFTDKDFHRYLRKLNIENDPKNEWFHVTGPVSRNHFYDFRANRGILQSLTAATPYNLREEQEDAVEKTLNYSRLHTKGEYLWNAKPRFGKTLTAYELCKQMDADTVLIVTNRPAIANSWYSDYEKFLGPDSGYLFVSDTSSLQGKPFVVSRNQYLDMLNNDDYKCIEFVSLQDLKGSIYFGGEFEKLKEVNDIHWDVLIIDEAHEGVDTYKTDDRIDIILDKGSINGFECTPEGAALLEPHSNAYVDIRWQEYAETYAENGNDPTSITEIVMPVFVRKDTGNNTVYIDATYSIDPQARTATPIVNPQ